MTARRTLSALVVAASLVAPALASAQDLDPGFEAVLAAIDIVPDASQLEARWPDAQALLIAAASDATRDGYTRDRAITLLSAFVDDTSRAALVALTSDADADVRRAAGYTLIRAWGDRADAELLAVAGRLAGDVDPDVRSYAVRALRWVDAAPAADLLVALASDLSDPDRAELARFVLERRGDRPAADGPTLAE